MNSLDTQYINLLKDILENGSIKNDRTGTGTKSVFGRQIRHRMSDGFPILTTKKINFKNIVTELLWFLRGDTHVKFLHDNDCHIWDGDLYKNYVNKFIKHSINIYDPSVDKDWESQPMSKKEFVNAIKTNEGFSELLGDFGPIYGKQWRAWSGLDCAVSSVDESGVLTETLCIKEYDQITKLINTLKSNPDDRRMLVSAWNVGDIDKMVLPPCHYGFQVWTRELSLDERLSMCEDKSEDIDLDSLNIPKRAISLMYNVRSQDVPLGAPYNISSYGLLLAILSRMTNMVPEELIANMGDCHIYLNQIDKINEQLERGPLNLPAIKVSNSVNFNGSIDDMLNSCSVEDFYLDGYESHDFIKIPLSN